MVSIIKKGVCVGMAGLMGGHSTIGFAKGSEDYYQCQESIRLYAVPCAPEKGWPEKEPHVAEVSSVQATAPVLIEGFVGFPAAVVVQQMLSNGGEAGIKHGAVEKSS